MGCAVCERSRTETSIRYRTVGRSPAPRDGQNGPDPENGGQHFAGQWRGTWGRVGGIGAVVGPDGPCLLAQKGLPSLLGCFPEVFGLELLL